MRNFRRLLTLTLASVVLAVACGPGGDPQPQCGTERACECQPGDADCSPCQAGYRTALVGSACVPTCNAPDIDCGAHGACEETAQGAACVCDPGFTGASCAMCEGGLSPNAAGQCLGELSAPALLSLSSINEEVVLGALVPPLWHFLPLAPVSSTVTDVAYDPSSEDVYVLDQGRLFSVDLGSGETVALSAASADLGSALCLDAAGRRVFTASADALYQVDLEAFEVTEVASFGARALEYDVQRGLVIGVDQQGGTFELAGSEPVVVGQAPELEALGMAFDAEAGRAYFLGADTETEQARLLRYCASALTRLGAVPAWETQVVSEVAAGDSEPYNLEYEGADSALIALDLGASGLDQVRVNVAHPDAAVCIVAESSATAELEIEVTADARASFILVVAPERGVALDVTALSDTGGSSIVVYTDGGLTIAGSSAGVAEYEGQAWENLGLTTLANLEARPASRLVLMDWASQAMLPLELTHQPVGSALAWVGESP